MDTYDVLKGIIDKINENPLTKIRLKNWEKVIKWEIDDETFYFDTKNERLNLIEFGTPDIILKCSQEVFLKIAENKVPFFIAYWITSELKCEGETGDLVRLGFTFPHDNRGRRVIFISNCWLNLNMRFPGGASMPGADVPLIRLLLDNGVGIIQMPCPEYTCFGLGKYEFGNKDAEEVRKSYRQDAEKVIKQVIDYKEEGYTILGIMGMNPSPSCGVEIAKGKGILLKTGADTSESAGSGVFIEEIKSLLKENNLDDVRVFGVRRHMLDEESENRLENLKQVLLSE